MKTEHSPGPWRIGDKEESAFNTHTVLDKDGFKVCAVESIPARTTGQADARLIAAAPELLAACREMVANMEDGESTLDCDGNEFSDYAAAKAAIAKAEGKP